MQGMQPPQRGTVRAGALFREQAATAATPKPPPTQKNPQWGALRFRATMEIPIFPGPGIGMKDGLTTANLPTGEWRL